MHKQESARTGDNFMQKARERKRRTNKEESDKKRR